MKFSFFPLALFFALTGLSSGAVVNIDFKPTTGGTQFTGLAAAPDSSGATAQWNSVAAVVGTTSGTALLNSAGVATTIGFQVLNVQGSANASATLSELERSGGFAPLLRDYIRIDAGTTGGTPISTTGKFSGLTVGSAYEIYFYGQGEFMSTSPDQSSLLRGQNSLFTVDSVSKQTAWDNTTGGDGLLVENIEYVKFTAVADVNGEISFGWANVRATGGSPNVLSDLAPNGNTAPTNTASRYAAINAIQIVAVPEPSAALLGGLGALGILARRRR